MNLKRDMNDREKYFFENIVIKKEDIHRAKQAIYSKGIEKHIIILDMLKAWGMGEKIPYEYIASFYRYDKRLRKVLFVYISYLEEYYRSLILDKYRFDWSELKLDSQLKQVLSTYHDLDKALERVEFSHLINQVYKIRTEINDMLVFPNHTHLRKNIAALVELRNSVMHNRLLLLYRGFEECYVSNDNLKSTTLKDNIKNLINFLPENTKEKCKSEINNCLIERDNENKTEWILPDSILIRIE